MTMNPTLKEPNEYLNKAEIEIKNIINSTKTKNSLDSYGMTTKFLKLIVDEIIQPIITIINFCVATGFFRMS